MVRGGRCYIFFEELMFATGKAHISVIEVDRSGRASPATKVLECDYHLSYPFLLEHEGHLFMIPETGNANVVEAYRCVEFPNVWKRERVLMRNIRAVDASFLTHEGRWWMFANAAPEGASLNDELHLFSSDHLFGNWEPHPGNPVKSDVRGARPAGRLYRRGGKVFRPAQVCVPVYGAGIAIHRIDRLDGRGYEEELVERIVPIEPEDVFGLHTINRAGDLCVVDAFMRRPRWAPGRER
jgi:hypothetical protein